MFSKNLKFYRLRKQMSKKELAERVNVTVGIITDEYTEIVSGIKKGNKVIVSGKEYLSEKNNSIKIVD